MVETLFVNREMEVKKIIEDDFLLLNICGESGIGKSRLLNQCKNKWQEKNQSIKIIMVDLAMIKKQTSHPIDAVLKDIIRQKPEMFEGVWLNSEQVAGAIVKWINLQTQSSQVYQTNLVMIFDTTEVMHNDKGFWDWLERFLIRPLLREKKVKIIFAGRSPIKWSDFEVRRYTETPLRLVPLDEKQNDGAARKMLLSLWEQKNLPYLKEQQEKIITIIISLSYGHPRLIEDLIEYLAKEQKIEENIAFELCKNVVRDFIEENFFVDISPEWRVYLWWMSVLDHFDTPLLKTYLLMVAPDNIPNQEEYYFLQGIRHLHENSILIWKEGQGEQFQGVMGKIIAKCLEITRKDDYIKANRVAAQVLRKIKQDFLVDEEDLKQVYENQAQKHDQRVKMAMEAV